MSSQTGETPLERLQRERIMDHRTELQTVGSYSVFRSGNSFGARCPDPFDDMLGFPEAYENRSPVRTFVDLQGGRLVGQMPPEQIPNHGTHLDGDDVPSLREVDAYKIMKGGSSFGIRAPHPFDKMLGFRAVHDRDATVEISINLSNGLLVATVPNEHQPETEALHVE